MRSSEGPPFAHMAEVLVLVNGTWRQGVISNMRKNGPEEVQYDVKWGGSELSENKAQTQVLAVREGGEGALLREAAGSGNALLVQLLLEAGVSAFVASHDASTALHVAAEAGHTDVVWRLLQYKADPQMENRSKETAYDLSLMNMRSDVRRVLDIASGNRCCAPHRTAHTNPTPTRRVVNVAVLTPAPCPVRCPTSESDLDLGVGLDHALESSSHFRRPSVATDPRHTLEHLSSLNYMTVSGDADKRGVNPLMLCCRRGGQEAVTEALRILDGNADIDAQSERGCCALSMAAERGRVDAVELLLSRRANVNAVSKKGFSPLMLACRYGHRDGQRRALELSCASR